MNQTVNLHLPQFAATDRIHHDDFNDAFEKIDTGVPRIVIGTYTGDGTASRTIPLNFTPKAVFFCDQSGHTAEDITYLGDKYFYGGLALTDYPLQVRGSFTLMEITTNGFTVRQQISGENHYLANNNGSRYFYIAIG